MFDKNSYIPDETLFMFFKYFRDDLSEELFDIFSINKISPIQISKNLEGQELINTQNPLAALSHLLLSKLSKLPHGQLTFQEKELQLVDANFNLTDIADELMWSDEKAALILFGKPEDESVKKYFLEKLSGYLNNFIHGDLHILNHNVLTYSHQKNLFLQKIKNLSLREKFGEQFVVKFTVPVKASFYPTHTLFALEQEDYLKVKSISGKMITDDSKISPEVKTRWGTLDADEYYLIQGFQYHFTIEITNKLEKMLETNHQFLHQQKGGGGELLYQGYNKKKANIVLSNGLVSIADKPPTQTTRLMEVIDEKPSKHWHINEVMNALNYEKHEHEENKKKIKQAFYRIKRRLKRATGREDILLYNHGKNHEFVINQKYLK